jgi:signal transduction histidine kinase
MATRGWRRISARAPRTGGAPKRNLDTVTAETPASSSLDAVRAARASRAAWQRRMLPAYVVIVVAVVYLSAKAAPHVGLHGKSLVLSLALAGFIVSGLSVRQMLVRRSKPVSPRVWAPVLALLLLSSGLLVWVQPTGPGAGGCVVAIAIAIAVRAISPRVGVGLIVLTIGVAAFVITKTASQHTHHQGFTGYLSAVVSFTGLFLYAMVVWRWRAHDEQSDRLLAQVEETRDAELRAAALSERQRLAREMHDVLAHSLSGLVVQLEGARLLALSDPADGRLAATIDRAHQLARSGLDEARRAIGMLRDDELPGPDKLAALARSFQADTGLPCQYTEAGTSAELRPAVKLALYRVTQEALTNIRKHAHPERVEVRLEYTQDGVVLVVEDFAAVSDLPAPAASVENSGGGYGLTGMRERAELLGGALTAGSTGHGFRVDLRVPA